jgi:glycosyltransferase involved in cell wall biosynthesis
MTNGRLRILFLSHAFPPGVSNRFPAIQNATHVQQAHMGHALERLSDFSSVGWLPGEVWGQLEPRDNSVGLNHSLLLWDLKPELWHRWRSWQHLRKFYLKKVRQEGAPDVLLVSNLIPVFNHFVRWLRRQPARPLIVLYLADCGGLGQPDSFARRLRYNFKPMQMLDNDAVCLYDACIALAIGTRRYFEPRGNPWLWMPSAFNFSYDPPATVPPPSGPIRFGYFGGLSDDSATLPLVRAFFDSGVNGSLHLCGFGDKTEALRELTKKHNNLHFDGLLKPAECMAWAQQVDVLINPRLPLWENSFPSKIFQYGITGKAILTTRIGGVDEVLGEHGLYFEAQNLEAALCQKLREVAGMNRTELQRRGMAIRQLMLTDFNWDAQAQRMIRFLNGILQTPAKT